MRTNPMIRTFLQYLLAVVIAYGLAISVARCTLPGAFAQAPGRPVPGTRLITARHAILPDARPALDGLLILTGATFGTETASGLPSCPDTLAGVSVWIGDEPQPLRLVTPYAIEVAPRRLTSWLVVRAADGRIYYAPVRMARISPAILLAARDGGDETQGNPHLTPLGLYQHGKGAAPAPVTYLGVPAPTADTFTRVSVQGTGWRHALPGELRATLGGHPCEIVQAGPTSLGFAGQDALTIEIPLALTARGPLDLVIEAAGQKSNVARVCVRD